MRKGDLLKAALEIVEKRGLTYGPAENNFARIAALWTTYLKDRDNSHGRATGITETDVAAMMALMKIARLMEKPDHLDSWLDLAGYAACGAEVSKAGEEKQIPLPAIDQKPRFKPAPTPEERDDRPAGSHAVGG